MPEDADNGYERLEDITNAVKNEGTEVTHVLRDVIRNYSDLGHDLQEYYDKNLRKFPETVERTANDVYHFAQTFKEDVNWFGNLMMNMSPPEKSSGFNISKTFANATFLLIVASISSFIGSYITAPVFGIIFLNLGAILVITIVIPLIASYVYYNLRVRSLAEKRIASCAFIFVQSVLIGFINQDDWVESAPFTVFTQMIASFVYPMVLIHTDNRQKILGSVAGLSIFCHLFIGLIFSGINGPFLMMAVMYTVLAVALIQYSIAFRTQTDYDMMHLAMQYVFLVSGVKMFALMEFGTDT
ncbi:uncharacterized protein CELE_F58A6.5 [Caenorhabditis elegans]|uniref:Uncharacterized protein n=1 Tax=Caenorhabditis elegans TaxID=6239 RepID=Q20960_CAEEL|nr:Uncharacterized protein CELE_F58A6.5 [Caenorhabditis elegans]CCD65836.1 Uncharacterized protein CELE_F58A6.5 [Caenorhabditis elegans]|eukprot:NP_494955.1 Uncharacterized protein CELE_F58A6.5 [Caenorhabditis elegans]